MNVEDELDKLAEQSTQLDIEIKHLEEAMGPLSKEVEKCRRAHEDMKNKNNIEYEERADLKRKYLQGVHILDTLNTKIERFEKENIPEKLNDLEEKQSLEESKLQSYDTKKQELLAEVNKTGDVVRNQDKLRRDIENNLRYREIKAKADGCTLKIESLRKNSGNGWRFCL